MTTDIFKLFKHAIEPVVVKKTSRGTLDGGTDVFTVTIDAIVKRRKMLGESVGDSEVRNSNTTIHFRQSDAQYVCIGNYVLLDNQWHSIMQVRDGKDFDNGVSKFPYAVLDNDIVQFTDDPVWTDEVISA